MEIKTYGELREQREQKISDLHEQFGLFWAFSQKQYEENKTPKEEDEKYVSIGGGGFVPKSKCQPLLDEMENIEKWYNEEIKTNFKKEAIAFELANHECYYTGEIDDVVNIFEGVFSKYEIAEVYIEERNNHNWN